MLEHRSYGETYRCCSCQMLGLIIWEHYIGFARFSEVGAAINSPLIFMVVTCPSSGAFNEHTDEAFKARNPRSD
ncbi:unnamed protein product [Strongylus vulgaris]|uniref:Uncharacterized protein n=1 Tax=Strongylus vulgaris TaxID=40348 RepID=A0A3P7IQ25_STRVU|nr:unnamed protein product [Strongylus vulgaris]